MRRKGERPIVRAVVGWSVDHQCARAIREGDPWFRAWMFQMSTPYWRLAKATRIPEARLREIEGAAAVTRAEIDALARVWWVTSEGLIESIGGASEVIA